VGYIYGDDLISQNRAGAHTYYHYDAQGSTRMLTNAAETVTDTYIYDAFGSLIDQAGATANTYLYTAEQYDANVGFYYLRARYYDQGVGRFTSQDAWQGNIFEPASLHKYLYANCNPVMFVDPSGEFSTSVTETLTVIGIGYTLNSIIMPNLAGLRSYAGRTDNFEMQFSIGGCIGYLLYFGVVDAYIWEMPPSRGNQSLPRQRGAFTVVIIGFGVGVEFVLPSGVIPFHTNSNRRIEYFVGAGSISSVQRTYKGIGLDLTALQMPEGTRIPLGLGAGPKISRTGASAHVSTAYWTLNYTDKI